MRIPRALAVVFLCVPSASAQVLGPEFQVNTYTTGGAYHSAIASSAAGEFVVTWVVWMGFDSSAFDVMARRYDASGAPVGGEFRVNTYTTRWQHFPALAVAPDGSFVILWESEPDGGPANSGVFGRRFDSSGGSLGAEFQVNTYTTSVQSHPSVGFAAGGGFVVSWASAGQDGSEMGVFGQRYDPLGAADGPEFPINLYTTGAQFPPHVGVAPDGRFAVVWSSGSSATSGTQDGSDTGVFGRRYDAAGAPAGPEFPVNVYTTGSQYAPAIAVNADGSFVVVWMGLGPGGYGITGRRFSAEGTPIGGEFLVSHYAQGNASPDIAFDTKGNFVVVWASRGYYPNHDIVGRFFDASGVPQGAEFRINASTTGHQPEHDFPAVAPLPDGRFVVIWENRDDLGVSGRRLAPDLIFRDGFEAGTLAEWSSAATDGGDLGVSPSAAMDSTVAGLHAVVDDTAGLYVQEDTPGDEDRYRARFYFDPNGFDPGETQAHQRMRIFLAFEEAPNRRVAAVVLRRLSGVYALMLRCRLDDDSQDDGAFFTISDDPHVVELDWKRSSGPDNVDGECRLWVDGSEATARTGLDNSLSGVDFVRLGALSVKTGATGSPYWDEFVSRRLSPIGP